MNEKKRSENGRKQGGFFKTSNPCGTTEPPRNERGGLKKKRPKSNEGEEGARS